MDSVDRGSKVFLKRTKRQRSVEEREETLKNLFDKGGIVIPCETAVTVHRAVGEPPSWEVVDYGMPAVVAKEGVLQVCVHDAIDGEKACEFAITPNSSYSVQEDFFHTFMCVDDKDNEEKYGVSFADGVIGRQAGKIVLQLLPPTHGGKEDRLSETDAGEVSQKGKGIFKNIRRFFSSRRHDETGQKRKLDISGPTNFQHVSHVGSGPLMYDPQQGNTEMESDTQSTANSTKAKRGPPQDEGSAAKKKKVDISGPMEFRHVAHLGETKFGESHVYSIPLPDEEGVDKGKRNSALSVLSRAATGQNREISAPFDPKHVAHVDKNDPIVHLLTAQGKKDPFVGASVVAGATGEPPEKPPRTSDPISANQGVDEEELPQSSVGTSEGMEEEQSSVKKQKEDFPSLEPARGEGSEESGEDGGRHFLSGEEPQKSTGSSDWSTISQTSDNISLGTLVSQDSREERGTNSATVGTQISARERKDSCMQTDPEVPSPPPNPPPPPDVRPRTSHLPAVPFNHEEFLAEIQSFKPSLLKDVQLRKADRPKAPPMNRLSMQTMMRVSFDKMREKLHSVWRESIFAYIPEEDEFEEEEEYDFASLVY
jgi:hypothetical protein